VPSGGVYRDDLTVEFVLEEVLDVRVVDETADHLSPSTGLALADDDDVRALGRDLLEDGLLDEEAPADDVPDVLESVDGVLDRPLQVSARDVSAVVVEVDVEDRQFGVPVSGDPGRLAERRERVIVRGVSDGHHDLGHRESLAGGATQVFPLGQAVGDDGRSEQRYADPVRTWPMDEVTGPEGATLYVASDQVERGSKGPFYVVYADPDRQSRWGFWCTNCETLDTAVDSMGRIECNRCRNLHKAEEWDAAHE